MRLPAVNGQPLTANPRRASGTSLNAVDAEQVIEEWAGEGQSEGDGDPAERRLRPALVQQRVQRGNGGSDEPDGGENGCQKLACLHAPMCNI
jgi:hypothetical protein